MTDHSVYLAENFTDFVYTPGFPYLRLHPALLLDDYPVQLSATEEQVLFVMHSTSNNLLVVTNRNVYVYKIPRYKPFLERLGGVGVKLGSRTSESSPLWQPSFCQACGCPTQVQRTAGLQARIVDNSAHSGNF